MLVSASLIWQSLLLKPAEDLLVLCPKGSTKRASPGKTSSPLATEATHPEGLAVALNKTRHRYHKEELQLHPIGCYGLH
tara:strand:+ start:309 stop:545 length:237 start_codon:yes stop_codon:yes gene_type:complete